MHQCTVSEDDTQFVNKPKYHVEKCYKKYRTSIAVKNVTNYVENLIAGIFLRPFLRIA